MLANICNFNKERIFYMNINISPFSGSSELRFSSKTLPAVLNSRSLYIELGGADRYFRQTNNKFE